jgi:hypothetical protein
MTDNRVTAATTADPPAADDAATADVATRSASADRADAGDGAQPKPGGLLRRVLHRLAADAAELDAEELQEDTAAAGATPVSRCCDGERVSVFGVLRMVMLRPRGGVPTLEAELYDGSGSVHLVWLGRRRIVGIEPGRQLVARGRLTVQDGRRTLFNPEYELRAG